MKVRLCATWRTLELGAIAGVLAVAPAWAQSSSPKQTAPPTPTHWGWYTPKPVPEPKPAQSPTKPPVQQKTVSQGGDTSGNRPPMTVTSSTSDGGGGGGVQTQQISVPGINGGTQSVVDQDTETTQINANTTRTVRKIYGQDPDGNRELIGIQQTDTTDLGGGKSQSETQISKIDLNGQMNVTRSETSETVPSGPDTRVTNVTVFTPGMYGQMAASQKIHEVEHSGKDTTQTDSTLMTPNGNGGWATTRKTETVVHQAGKDQQTEDKKVFTIDGNGNLSVAQRVVTRDWKGKDGQDHQEVSTYVMTPGGEITAHGGGLALVQRVSTSKVTKPNGAVETVQRTEQSSPVSMSEGLKVTGEVIDVATPTKAGAVQTQRSVLADDGNGQLRQVSVFTGQERPAQAKSQAKPASAGGKQSTAKNVESKK